MANLDSTIARLKALPKDRQDAVAAQIDLILEESPEELLSAEQWAAVEARLDSGEGMTPHDEIVRAFRSRVP